LTTKLPLALLAAAVAAVCLAGDGLGAHDAGPTTEVVVTLKAPALASFGRSLHSPAHAGYLRRLDAAQEQAIRNVRQALPQARIRWRFHLVADGFAVVLPASQLDELARVPGVAEVWSNVAYPSAAAVADNTGEQVIGADKLWGANFETAGNGMKIGIIDDGLDASHPYFNSDGFQYPPGFPKTDAGDAKYATPKVIVQRTFTPPGETWKYAKTPFDPANSFHATHVAGIAAGDLNGDAAGHLISGVAPNAYLGNYKALTVPTPGFGLDGNSTEIAAAIEAAVADGMNVINLSLGEPEVQPQRDIVVAAIDAAAQAGVVPVVAAGNDFDDFGYGSVGSPGNAPGAITVAASTLTGQIAGFSSAGPTPVSLQMKPDVTAPGASILSSLPASQGTWGLLSGTSMATPHVAGAAALLEERHPTWTVDQIKSALEQTGDPVHDAGSLEAPTTREGGGVIDLARADNPLVFVSPTGLSFGELAPGATGSQTLTLSDAGGGAGAWSATAVVQAGPGSVSVPAAATVPGTLPVSVTAGSKPGDVTGFVVLTRGSDVRRVPFWFAVVAPKLGTEPEVALTRPGTYTGSTAGGPSKVTSYRYPTSAPVGGTTFTGPERVYKFTLRSPVANAGVVVLSGSAVPHVVLGASEDHLAGYTGLPMDINPYREQYGTSRPVAGLVLPTAGTYQVVFDTLTGKRPGPFTFRFWVGDTKPPALRVTSTAGGIVLSATDAGSGVDPQSVTATVDGRKVTPAWKSGRIRLTAPPGRHAIVVTAADYQETKNMEDVGPVLPNTATLRATVTVR
jgi:subtilisin family serine protease